MNDKISVIIPCYNCEKTIERCLNSVLTQGYYNIEVIPVNDGSTDRTEHILNTYADLDSRVRPIHQKNSGPSAARNAGLAVVKGDWVTFADSDDYVRYDIYQKMLYVGKKDNADIIVCNYTMVFPDGKETPVRHCLKNKYTCNEEIINGVIQRYYCNNNTGMAAVWNKLFKNSFIQESNQKFDTTLYYAEDWWFVLKLLERAERLSTVDDELYYYWQGNPTSLMHALKPELYAQWKKAKQYLLSCNQKYGFTVDYDLFYREFLYNVHSLLIRTVKDKNNARRILEDSFYANAIQYDKGTGRILRGMHIVHKRSIQLELILYRVIALYFKI